jgi:hypothetical protein
MLAGRLALVAPAITLLAALRLGYLRVERLPIPEAGLEELRSRSGSGGASA